MRCPEAPKAEKRLADVIGNAVPSRSASFVREVTGDWH
jgi:hypothetical protein